MRSLKIVLLMFSLIWLVLLNMITQIFITLHNFILSEIQLLIIIYYYYLLS
jgi:hypothetical protein